MFATTVEPWEEEEENLSLSQNAVLFLETALKGLRSSLWQQRGFAVQTTHILRLTPVNWAGGFTQVCLSLESSMLPQSHMTAGDWHSGLLNDLAQRLAFLFLIIANVIPKRLTSVSGKLKV